MKSKFIGFWSGIVEGAFNGRISVRIKGVKNYLSGFAILNSDEGYCDLVTFRGEEENDATSKFKLCNYISSGINVIPPREGTVKLTFLEDSNEIKGEWSTDIGTSGILSIWKAGLWDQIKLLIPHSIYRFYLRWINLRNIYLFFVFILVLLSLLGWIAELNTIVGIILIIPIFYLFRSKIRDVLLETGIKKAGPLEFYQQSEVTYHTQLSNVLNNLRERFGSDKVNQFLYLTIFFVPKTKLLLKRISTLIHPITLEEFIREAKRLNISDDNIYTTLQALINLNCLSFDKETGKISVQTYGREFLQFESAVSGFANI